MLSVFCLPCLLSQALGPAFCGCTFSPASLGSQLQSSEDFSLTGTPYLSWSFLRLMPSPSPSNFLGLFAQFSSVSQLCLTLCNPSSMPGFSVLHQLLEFTQTHVHQVSDAIQPSHPLSFPSPAFNLSQHQGLFR